MGDGLAPQEFQRPLALLSTIGVVTGKRRSAPADSAGRLTATNIFAGSRRTAHVASASALDWRSKRLTDAASGRAIHARRIRDAILTFGCLQRVAVRQPGHPAVLFEEPAGVLRVELPRRPVQVVGLK